MAPGAEVAPLTSVQDIRLGKGASVGAVLALFEVAYRLGVQKVLGSHLFWVGGVGRQPEL